VYPVFETPEKSSGSKGYSSSSHILPGRIASSPSAARELFVCEEATCALTLHRAVASGSVAEVQRFLDRQADVNECGADGDFPLHKAATFGHVPLVGMLLQARADPDAMDRKAKTALRKAYHSAELAAALLDARANPDLPDSGGRTVLHLAAENGQIDVLQLLISSGAKVSAATLEEGTTPLHEAASFGQVEALTALLSARANPLIADSAGNSALHCAACARESLEVTRLLLRAHADPLARNAAGETALQCAEAAEREETAALLRRLR